MEIKLPQLPDGYRYGAETSAPLTEEGNYFVPEGCVIKLINKNAGQVIYVPIQVYVPEKNTWYTVNLNAN